MKDRAFDARRAQRDAKTPKKDEPQKTAAEAYRAAATEVETTMEALADAIEQSNARHAEDPSWTDVAEMKRVRDLVRGALAVARGVA